MRTKLIFTICLLFTVLLGHAQLDVTISSAEVSPTKNGTFSVSITFSGGVAVTGFLESEITISNASISSFNNTGNPVFTFDISPTAEGLVTVDVAADVCDETNNAATQFSIEYDITAPTVSLLTTVSSPTNLSVIPVTATFSEAVTGFTSGDITLSGGTLSGFSTSDNIIYTFNLNVSTSGTYTVNVASAVCADAAGNSNTAAAQLSLLFDNIRPTPVISSVAPNPTNTSPIPFEVDFGEDVTGFTLTDISVNGGTKGGFTAITASRYSFTVSLSSDLVLNVNIPSASCTDIAGNQNFSATQYSIEYDKGAPQVTSIVFAEANPTNASLLHATIQFNETVKEFVIGDITVTNGTLSNFVAVSGSKYTVDITPTSDGTISLSLLASVCKDNANNQNIASSVYSIEVDRVRPSIQLVSSVVSPTNQSPFMVTANVSEATSTFAIGDITVSGATLSGFTSVNSSTYTFDVTPITDGFISLSVAESTFTDLALNASIASSSLSVAYDGTVPVPSVSCSLSSPTNVGTIPCTVDFGETVTGFTSSDITISGGTISGFTSTNNRVFTFNLVVTNPDTYTVSVPAGCCQDMSGNLNSLSNALIITYDNVKPTLTSVTIASNHTNTSYVRVGKSVTLSFVASEAIKDVVVTIKGHAVTASNTSGNSWSASYTFTEDDVDGVVPFTVNFKDISGNVATQVSSVTSGGNVTFDGTKPAISSVSISTNNASVTYAKPNDIVTVGYSLSEAVASQTVTIGGAAATITGGPSSWTASRTFTMSNSEGLIPFSISVTDNAGNVSSTVTSVSNSTSVTFDKTPPAISAVTVPSGTYKVGDDIIVSITANSSTYTKNALTVNGYEQALVNNNNGTYSATYTVQEGHTQQSAVSSLPVEVILADVAGNTNVAVLSAVVVGGTLTIDSETPVITNVYSDAELAGNLIIGDAIIFSVVPSVAQLGLTVQPQVYNGKPISWTPDATGATYSATYVVTEGDDTQSTPLHLAAVTLSDLAGNTSGAFTYSGVQKSIYASKPSVSIGGTTTKCDNGETVPITFSLTGNKPFTLAYSDGTTVHGPIVVDANTYAIDVERGTYSLVSLADVYGNSITAATQNATITVNPLPTLTFDVLGSPFNIKEPPVNLVPYATPAGGQFTGDGVGTNKYFYPSVVGVEGSDITVTITYTYTDGNGCTSIKTDDVIVSSGGAVISDLKSTYCKGEPTGLVRGTNPSAAIGAFSVSTVNGWTDNGDNTLTLNPSVLLAGNHTITYSYLDGGTLFSSQRVFTVDSVGVNVDFINLQSQYCVDASDATLTAVDLYPSGGSGHFSFTGLADGFATVPGSNSALLQPRFIATGQTNEVSYYYTSPLGCKSNVVTKEVIVNPLPEVDFAIRDNYNFSESPVVLIGNYSGGTFSSGTVVHNNNTLYPNLFTPGILPIRYTYTNPVTGCSNSIEKQTRILKANEVIQGLGTSYCYSTDTLDIECFPIVEPSVVGTFYSRRGAVIASEPNKAKYLIARVGNGVDTVFYRYSIEGTPYEVFTRVVVDSIGKVSLSGLENGYCIDAQQVQLFGTDNHPQGTGVFTFTGNSSAFSDLLGGAAILRPAQCTVGTYSVTYTYTSGISGCISDTTRDVAIFPLPSVSFSIPEYYNIDEPVLDLVGEPLGGIFSAPRGVYNNRLTPVEAGVGPLSITYSYTDVNGCASSNVQSLTIIGADAQILGIPSSGIVCLDGEPIQLVASSTNGLPGYFEGNGIANISPDTATFSPVNAGEGQHIITYKYLSSADGLTQLYRTATITVDNPGSIEILGFSQTEYCNDDVPITLVGVPSGGTFSGQGMLVNRFYPSDAVVGTNTVSYTYVKPESGCSVIGTATVDVKPVPDVHFALIQTCSDLTSDSVQFINRTMSDDEVESWLWSFGQGEGSSIKENPKYFYATSGSKRVVLTATTARGCSASKDSIVTIGLLPRANFTWLNECLTGDATTFTSTTEDALIVNYTWKINEEQVTTGESASTFSHLFSDVGGYNVKLIVQSADNCLDSITKAISILPVISFSNYPENIYTQDFESGIEYWSARAMSESGLYSWELGAPSGSVITHAASGSNAWFTSIDNENQVAEQSQVLSPCFDFSSLQKPMIKMNVWSSPEAGRNGAVLQYTTNSGVTWQNVGDVDTGIEWFNSQSIKSQPGGQLVGWSSEPMVNWSNARHSLDMVKGYSNVRFRIAFAADGNANTAFDGFAFDDVWIGDREQLLLLEYFTNTSVSGTSSTDAAMQNLLQANSLDVVGISYHSSAPAGDPFYTDYPEGASSRELFYGVSAIPSAFANGYSPLTFQSFAQNQPVINIEALADPSFKIDANVLRSGNLRIQVMLKALSAINNSNMVLQCALVQREVNLAEPLNGSSVYYNVIRDFVPNAGGTSVKSVWEQGEQETYQMEWNVPAATNLATLKLVVFVQDVSSKKVYQTYSLNLSTITSVDTDMYVPEVYVYPNPAEDYIVLESPNIMDNATIFDITGQMVMVVNPNAEYHKIPVAGLKQGMYLVRVRVGKHMVLVKFVKQ